MDPIITGTIVGGFAGEFAEKVWDSGQKWLESYFYNHGEKAQEQAKRNSLDFLVELASKVKVIEEKNYLSKEDIQTAQERPDFTAVLQKAILNSAETDNHEKHVLLARLVSEKLKTKPESTTSLATKMACNAIAYANIEQLKILGLQVNLLFVEPSISQSRSVTQEQVQKKFRDWLISRLIVYHTVTIKPLDILHLQSLNCLYLERFLVRELAQILSKKILSQGFKDFSFDVETFQKCDIGRHVFKLWNNQGLEKVDLTPAGMMIGVYVSDMLTGTMTNLNEL